MTDRRSPQGEMPPRDRRTIYVVLPAYNEEAAIGSLLHRIGEAMREAALPYQVILVDDGSQDATVAIVKECARRMPIVLEQHLHNLGLGPTVRDGLTAATQLAEDQDIVVTMDADDTHTPGLIAEMVQMISEGHDVVIASRYQHGARTVGVPLLRALLSRSASIVFRILFPIPGVRDFTSGYRAYRAQVIKGAFARYGQRFLDQQGFQCMVDILLKLRPMNLSFGEVPMILRYDRKGGESKMKVFRTALATLRLMLRIRFGGSTDK